MKPTSLTTFVMHAALWLILSTFALQALAESDTTAVIEMRKMEVQSPVKAWLELQSSGEAASSQPQPLSGPAMNRVQERFLKSFSHPMPPYFEHVQSIDN